MVIEVDMSSSFITAKHLAIRENHASTAERIERQRMQFMHTHPLADQKKGGGAEVRPVFARIDFGRWLADCECNGAEYVDPDYPLFFCNSCGNQEFNGQSRPVEFPDEQKRAAIEKVLSERPVDDSRGVDVVHKAMLSKPLIPGLVRSWNPGESISDLRAQNRKAGLK
ncbi:MAG TPA: hypothetical protein DCP32_11395 [Anaerolineaceae bacterium]|nr:hypothetical protein [Anaerolineaceae bacterium]HBA91110.1 hypothetical protein [Anaerolineaceae bacterium]